MCGAEIISPCVNKSDYGCTVEGKRIYLGLGFIHGLERDTAQRIQKSKWTLGSFKSLLDFTENIFAGKHGTLFLRDLLPYFRGSQHAFYALGIFSRSLTRLRRSKPAPIRCSHARSNPLTVTNRNRVPAT